MHQFFLFREIKVWFCVRTHTVVSVKFVGNTDAKSFSHLLFHSWHASFNINSTYAYCNELLTLEEALHLTLFNMRRNLVLSI